MAVQEKAGLPTETDSFFGVTANYFKILTLVHMVQSFVLQG